MATFKQGAQYVPTTQFGQGDIQQALAQQAPEEAGFFTKLMNAFQNPDFIVGAQKLGASIGGQKDDMEQADTAYRARRAEIAAKQQEIQQKQQQEVDLAEQRKYNEQQQYTQHLYSTYTPESVQAYSASGNQADLIKKPEKKAFREKVIGNDTYRVAYDPYTGIEDTSVPSELVSKYHAPIGRTHSGGSGSSSNASDIGLDINKLPLGLSKVDGQYVVVEQTTKGRVVKRPTATEIKTWGLNQAPDAGEKSLLTRALDPYITGGQEIPMSQANWTSVLNPWSDKPIGAGVVSAVSGGETRALNQYLDLIDAQGTIKGIEAAREAGASGINTPAEFKTFKAAFPALDRSSPENLKVSIQRQRAYVDDWNRQVNEKKLNFRSFDAYGNEIGQPELRNSTQQKQESQQAGNDDIVDW